MSADLDQLADRHFRPDPQGVLAPKGEGQCGRVLVTVAQEAAATPAGQHLAWMLVNQLSRQFGVVAEITLRVPESSLLRDTAAFGAKESLRETLTECIRLVADKHVGVSVQFEDKDRFDVHIVVGGPSDRDLANRTWCTYADGWRWHVGSGAHVPRVTPSSALSFGPYMAASFVAGEVFKNFRGMRPDKGAFITESFGSVWTMGLSDAWDKLTDGPPHEELPILPHFYFAGAGAVAHAAALTLGSSRIKGAATAIDHDELDVTNDNRYVLSTINDEGAAKARLLSSYLTTQAFPCHSAPVKWSKYVSACGGMAANDEIAALERQNQYPLVLSCVDKNLPRHEIQTALPKVIIGGSTDGLTAKTQIFYLGHEVSCLKCFNPIEDRNEAIQRNLVMLAGMTPEERNEWCREHGISTDDLARFLAPNECGKLSEADLERFAKGVPDMSVGFVSVAAGILLAAQLVRISTMGVDTATANGHLVTATFARPGIRHRKSGPDVSCDCQAKLRDRWRHFWQN